MTRRTRSDVELLRQEARAMELLATEIDVPPSRLQEYWDVSANLLNLVTDIDEFSVRNPHASADDSEMIALRHRVRAIAAALSELASDGDASPS